VSVQDRLKAIEHQLTRMGAQRILLDDEIDQLDDMQADMALRGETDRIAQLSRLEAEQRTLPDRRNHAERQERLF
jgi:hypothetical protein